MSEDKKDDIIEIPIGKIVKIFNLNGIRKNIWILATFVLAIVLIAMFFMNGFGNEIVSEKDAGNNLVSFVNAQSDSQATLVNVNKKGGVYEVTISIDGQDVPIYVTLDGKLAFLPNQAIPLTDDFVADFGDVEDNGNTETSLDKIDISGSPVKGSASAEVTIVEFSDYECPFCGKFYSETLGLIDNNYIKTGKAKLVYKDFPLTSIHPQAQKAAEAARCVREQEGDEGYFKMHDLIFKNQALLNIDNLKKWALQLGVKIDSCLDSNKYASEVSTDLTYGSSLGISGTPGFFIGNDEKGYTQVSGAQPYSVFEQIIESYLN